jgi:single-stranded-DNA-specific exonuclease
MTTPPATPVRLPPLQRVWEARGTAAAEDVARLERALQLPTPLCTLLATRGFTDPSDARDFLKPRLERMHDPAAFAGMADAVARIRRAIEDGEGILVHGDYDVDGICAAAMLTRVLRGLGARADAFVPHRLLDGYDLGPAGIRAAAAAGARLIVTADCGTVAHDAVDAARASGIDVIITDHHTPAPTLPAAVAVLNPNRPDCGYPFKGLAGVGVAFKLCQALHAACGAPADALLWYLDLVALASVADLAPLTGENRLFVRYGLRLLPQTRNTGLGALLDAALVDRTRPVTAGQASHVIAPRINAVGRMGAAARGLSLLLTDDAGEAASLAAVLEEENRERRAVDRETLRHALAMLESDYDPARDYGVVLASTGWHPGVIGIVASRVVERIHRPTVLIALDDDGVHARGSARSIARFHLYDAIRDCGHLLERYGGHRQAAGMDIRPDRIAAFRAAFNERARTVLTEDDLRARCFVDLDVRLSDVTPRLFDLLRHFGPFGLGNPTPLLAARNVRLARLKVVGSGHARVALEQDGARFDGIGFGMADAFAALQPGDARVDLVFHLHEDEWNGRRRLQAKIVDVRPAG